MLGLTFSIDEPLSWGRVGGGQLLFHLGNVLGVKVVEQALTYQVVLKTRERTEGLKSDGNRAQNY